MPVVILRLLVLIAFPLTSADALAERKAALPADDEDSLAALIGFPELRGDTTVVIRCAARVTSSGKMSDNGCAASSPADQIFVEPINKAARKARLQPAVADRRTYEIYYQYLVEFIKEGENETINVFPNPGVAENVEAYGKDHVAAQRAIGKEPWQKICPKRARYNIWLKGHVAEDGTASNFTLTHGSGLNPPPRCQEAILESAQESLFFPALADGDAVPSTYVEPYGN